MDTSKTSIYDVANEKNITISENHEEREALGKELAKFIRRDLGTAQALQELLKLKVGKDFIKEFLSGVLPSLAYRIMLLTKSLKEVEEAKKQGIKMWPEDERGPHGFTLWFARLGRRLGSNTCNDLGIKLCQEAGFTVQIGEQVIRDLKEMKKDLEAMATK